MTDTERHVWLSWKIIEHKILYYAPRGLSESYVNSRSIADSEYDAMEIEYLTLCLKLDKPNTVVHKSYPNLVVSGPGMHEVDISRRSVQLAYMYLQKKDV